MALLTAVGFALIVAILSIYLLLVMRKKTTVVLFIDAPDPDNPAAAMAIWRYILEKEGHIHIVLTGRPVNLRTKKHFSESVPIKEQIPRQNWEASVPEHAGRVLEDSALRIATYLEKCGVPSDAFTIYDGGVAREAPLSDVAHDWDFIFDRKDLVTQRGGDKGEMLSPGEYGDLVDKYNALSETEREQLFLSILRRYSLVPLESLCSSLGRLLSGRILIFLGGPATAMVKLFKGRSHLCNRVTEFYAMFGSLRPGETTLLANQFNAACDLQATREVFVDRIFPRHVTTHLVTTETAKQPVLILSAKEMEERGVCEHVVKLQRLWESTHGNRPQPMFDVLPVMAALTTYRDCFVWLRKTPNIKSLDHKVFCLEDTHELSSHDTCTVLASDNCCNCDKETFTQFFVRIWK